MKCLLFGLGQMGVAIRHGMEKLGFEVTTNDLNNSDADWQVDTNNITEDYSFSQFNSNDGFDIVISALPYFCNEKVAKWAIDRKIPYVDLGGRVDVSEKINRYAEENQSYVFTDLGLAPGWINIVATQGALELGKIDDVENMQMYVGGLPEYMSIENPLHYSPTWSIDGLLNEYRDSCDFLERGEVVRVPGLTGHEKVRVWENIFEAFHTSGGLAHTIKFCKDKGIPNCCYKTLRGDGISQSNHADIMKWLLDNISDDEIEKLLGETTQQDAVWMHVKVTGNNGFSFVYSNFVRSDYSMDEDDTNFCGGFTAMQKSTAFPLSAAAALLAEGKLGHLSDRYGLGYESLCGIDMPAFNANLHTLGIEGNTLL